MRRENLHEKIVGTILPKFAEELRKEAVICSSDRKPFAIPFFEDRPPIKIVPDLVVHLVDGKDVLVEVANPRDPKRFLGEIVYPQILGYYKKISTVIFFVLHDRKRQKIHDRGFYQKMVLSKIFGRLTHTIMISWALDETVNYHNLRYILTREILKLSPEK
jgi:hypothetical protein